MQFCPLLALNRRAERPCECLLSGQKQTERGNDKTSEFDPEQTFELGIGLGSLIRATRKHDRQSPFVVEEPALARQPAAVTDKRASVSTR
jgi:hypothetical protein